MRALCVLSIVCPANSLLLTSPRNSGLIIIAILTFPLHSKVNSGIMDVFKPLVSAQRLSITSPVSMFLVRATSLCHDSACSWAKMASPLSSGLIYNLFKLREQLTWKFLSCFFFFFFSCCGQNMSLTPHSSLSQTSFSFSVRKALE